MAIISIVTLSVRAGVRKHIMSSLSLICEDTLSLHVTCGCLCGWKVTLIPEKCGAVRPHCHRAASCVCLNPSL